MNLEMNHKSRFHFWNFEVVLELKETNHLFFKLIDLSREATSIHSTKKHQQPLLQFSPHRIFLMVTYDKERVLHV
jgi:hypothetical protein